MLTTSKLNSKILKWPSLNESKRTNSKESSSKSKLMKNLKVQATQDAGASDLGQVDVEPVILKEPTPVPGSAIVAEAAAAANSSSFESFFAEAANISSRIARNTAVPAQIQQACEVC